MDSLQFNALHSFLDEKTSNLTNLEFVEMTEFFTYNWTTKPDERTSQIIVELFGQDEWDNLVLDKTKPGYFNRAAYSSSQLKETVVLWFLEFSFRRFRETVK